MDKSRLIPENFDNKKGLNPIQTKNLKQSLAKVPLDSGAIAKLPYFEQPVDRRGPFDMGLLPTWILYGLLFLLVLTSVAGLVLTAMGLSTTLFGITSTQNQQIKLFGLVLSTSVFTSSFTLLTCFCVQHAKEVGWVPSPEAPNEKKSPNVATQNAKISALYSIDPTLQQDTRMISNTPVSPTQLQPELTTMSTQQLISN